MVNVVNKYKEPDHIYCGRGSALGNPFPMKNESERDEVCNKYEEYFYEQVVVKKNPRMLKQLQFIQDVLATKGYVNLGCFCAPKRCHCDTIKEYIQQRS